VTTDTLVARSEEVPAKPEAVKSSALNKRQHPRNPIPLEQRLLIDLADAAQLMSVSYRTAKRTAADHPELTTLVGRRRLFVRAKLEAWIASGGDKDNRR
jgi:hypothetical protein